MNTGMVVHQRLPSSRACECVLSLAFAGAGAGAAAAVRSVT